MGTLVRDLNTSESETSAITGTQLDKSLFPKRITSLQPLIQEVPAPKTPSLKAETQNRETLPPKKKKFFNK